MSLTQLTPGWFLYFLLVLGLHGDNSGNVISLDWTLPGSYYFLKIYHVLSAM